MRSSSTAALLCSGLVLAIVSPLVAHLSWRTLAVALDGPVAGLSLAVSLGAVGVAAASGTLAAWALHRGRRALAWGLALPLAATTGAALAGGPGALSLLGVAVLTLAAMPRMSTELSETWSAAEVKGPALGLWVAIGVGCVLGSVNLATYLGEPSAEAFGLGQGTHLHRHFCATAYRHASTMVAEGLPNVYDPGLVPAEDSGALPATAADMAPFTLDRYGYPPQFLVLPMATTALVPDFAAWRSLWACANALFFAAVMWRMAAWVGPRSGRVLRFLGPTLWLSAGITHQSGNIHLTVFGIGLLAMMAVHTGRDRAGGLWLAAATLAKIAPGLLGVLLLVQGRWRAVAWTVAWAAAMTVLALVVTGPEVFLAFVEVHLPAVSSGQAYDFLDDSPQNIFENLSPFGLPFKLAAMGLVDWDPWQWGPRFARVYTVLAFGLAIVAGRRTLDRRGQLAAWMVVLTVASLRSPMAAGYMLSGVILGLALVGAEVRTVRGWVGLCAIVAALMLTTPSAPHHLELALAGQAVMHGAILWLVLRPWPVLDAGHPPRPLGA